MFPGLAVAYYANQKGLKVQLGSDKLLGMEFNLVNAMSRETALRNYLSEVKDKYDYC